MISALLVLSGVIVAAPMRETRILFLGNSHTTNYDVPRQVEALLESDGKGRQIAVDTRTSSYLNDFWGQKGLMRALSARQWDVVVMQAAKVSSSHKFSYSQEGGINIGKLAKSKGAKTYLFVEWPRRGWNESNLQMAVYRKIQAQTGAQPIPICYSWDRALKAKPDLDLWMRDGNHSNEAGAYLASAVIYYQFTKGQGTHPRWKPAGLDAGLAKFLLKTANETVSAFKG